MDVGGFLKRACYNETSRVTSYKCATSEDISYQRFRDDSSIRLTAECQEDPHGYQACGFGTEVSKNLTDATFCGKKLCVNNDKYSCGGYIECSKNSEVERALRCDDKCDTEDCIDESECGGYRHGLNCGDDEVIPAYKRCDGQWDCRSFNENGETADEMDCELDDALFTCPHYVNKA